ncbi:Calcineurin-like phosphoesterase, putative [Leishmania guyanensis]
MSGDLNQQLEAMYEGRLLTEEQVVQICSRCKDLMLEEGNIETIYAPVTLCGDIHGQFYDLLELFGKGGRVPDTSYVFMGDYVDRGYHSVETLLLLLLLKARYPDRITLLRGNHESRQITQVCGLYDECCCRYGDNARLVSPSPMPMAAGGSVARARTRTSTLGASDRTPALPRRGGGYVGGALCVRG